MVVVQNFSVDKGTVVINQWGMIAGTREKEKDMESNVYVGG